MTLRVAVVTHVLAPAYDRVRGTRTMQCLRELEQSQWWPAERIHELQSERLQKLITYAYMHVPYYRAAMDACGLSPSDIRSAMDLPRLPVLTKAGIRAAGDSLLAQGFDWKQLRSMRTSGSTGEPLAFFASRDEQSSRGVARALRATGWAGIRLGERYATLRRPPSAAGWRDGLVRALNRRLRGVALLDCGGFSGAELEAVVHRLRRGRFRGIGGSPPVLYMLADYIRRRGLTVPVFAAVICSGEQLYPHERRLLKQVFGTEPYSKYSSFEVYDIASECVAHCGLHIQAEDVVVEIVDDNGNAVPDGQAGRVLVTSLHNYGMPLIRYENGDYGALLRTICDCGRELPRLVDMLGRTSEFIVTASGRRVFAANIDLEALQPLGVRRYRLVQDQTGCVHAYIVWHDDVSLCARVTGEELIRNGLTSSIGDETTVVVHTVSEMPATLSGKHQVVVSKLASRQKHAGPNSFESAEEHQGSRP